MCAQPDRDRILLYPDAETLARRAAQFFLEWSDEAHRKHQRFCVALAGGATPRRTYRMLAAPPVGCSVPWEQVHLFWSDERWVGPDHADSNYRMVRENLIDQVAIPAANVHAVKTQITDPAEAARDYEREIWRVLSHTEERIGPPPRFDLVFLGLGADGHTASLFPRSSALHDRANLVRAVWVPELQAHRVTLTPGCINLARRVVFIVTGSEKAQALRQTFESAQANDYLPARAIAPLEGELTWLVDSAAASLL